MFEFFARLFRSEPSGRTAKERLRLVLLSDHLALSPDVVESLKTDLLGVISRYMEVDEQNVDVTFEQREHEVAMLANIPIRSMKPREELPKPALATVTPLPTTDGGAETPVAPKPRRRRRRRGARSGANQKPPAPVEATQPTLGTPAQA